MLEACAHRNRTKRHFIHDSSNTPSSSLLCEQQEEPHSNFPNKNPKTLATYSTGQKCTEIPQKHQRRQQKASFYSPTNRALNTLSSYNPRIQRTFLLILAGFCLIASKTQGMVCKNGFHTVFHSLFLDNRVKFFAKKIIYPNFYFGAIF